MASPVQLWRDTRGFLHETEAAANDADQAFELVERRAIVKQMLVDRVREARSASGDTFRTAGSVAEWLIDNWPALRAIGFSLRVHELAVGEAVVGQKDAA